MIKTGIKSTAYFGLDDYKTGLKLVKEHGYDCIDFQEFMSMNSPLYAMSDEEFAFSLNNIRDEAKANGIEIYQLHSIWPTAGDDTEEGRQKSLWYYRRSILGAKHLGCKRVVVHPWMPHGWSNGTKEEFFEINVRLMRELMPAARECNVYVCLENMPFRKGETFSTVEEWLAVLQEVNDEHAKACLDTGHLEAMGVDPYVCVLAIKDYLEAMHVHDSRRAMDLHLFPYQGVLDWEAFVRGLREIHFDGCIALETAIADGVPAPAKEPMQKALAKLARSIAEQVGD
jgi:sugar phosphate isomerase/epimerase